MLEKQLAQGSNFPKFSAEKIVTEIRGTQTKSNPIILENIIYLVCLIQNYHKQIHHNVCVDYQHLNRTTSMIINTVKNGFPKSI